MNSETVGSKGLALTSLDWLVAHHETKIDERKEMVSKFGLSLGDHILDIACGPGFWTNLLLEKVGANGLVEGIDIDEDLIQIAKKEHANLISKGQAKFYVGDMRQLCFEDNTFDIVMCGNAYNYLKKEELPFTLKEHLRVVKPGGKLSIRAFDNTMSMFHPVPIDLLISIMQGVAKKLGGKTDFDNYLGKKLHGLLSALNCGPVETSTFVTQKTFPLSDAQSKYIEMKGLWYAEQAETYCSQSELKLWKSLFNSDSDSYILNREDFYFNTLEMMSCVTKVKE